MPLLYYKGEATPDQMEIRAQKNMGRFMKILLIKRLESSFYVFQNSVARFVSYYDRFLKELANGKVYISKDYANKIFDLLENDDDEAVQELRDSGKAEEYPAKDFDDYLQRDLENDRRLLKEIEKLWRGIKRDPKLLRFVTLLSTDTVLKEKKVIVFTE